MTIPAHIERGGSQIVVGNGHNAPTAGAGPVEWLTLARPALPCAGCAHAPVCVIRPLLDADKLALRSPAAPHAAVRIRLALEVECDHFLAADVTLNQTAPITPERETWAVGQARRGAALGASRARGAAGLVKARAVKAERHEAAGGGPGKPERSSRWTDAAIAAAVDANGGNFSAAARALGCTKQLVGQRMRSLRRASAGSTEVES